jgi:hypothetical protein
MSTDVRSVHVGMAIACATVERSAIASLAKRRLVRWTWIIGVPSKRRYPNGHPFVQRQGGEGQGCDGAGGAPSTSKNRSSV